MTDAPGYYVVCTSGLSAGVGDGHRWATATEAEEYRELLDRPESLAKCGPHEVEARFPPREERDGPDDSAYDFAVEDSLGRASDVPKRTR